MGIAPFYVAVLIVGSVSIAPSIADVVTDVVAAAAEKVATDQLALVNFGAPGAGLLSHVATTSTQILSGTGDKLDFTGDHFFGRDQQQHEYNRQAHVNLEHVRHQDPHLRRFLGKSIVKRQGPYPPRVDPPTHYGPPPTTTTSTTTTTEPPTTTTTTTTPPPPPPTLPPVELVTLPPLQPQLPEVVVPHEEYGLPPAYQPAYGLPPASEQSLYAVHQVVGGFGSSSSVISDVSDGTTGTGCSDCAFSVLPPLPALVYPSLPSVPVPGPPQPTPLGPGDQFVGDQSVGVFASGGATGTGCTDCTFSSPLAPLPVLVYPSLQAPVPAVPERVPEAVPPLVPEDLSWAERGPETTNEAIPSIPLVQLPPLPPAIANNPAPISFAGVSVISVPAEHLAEEPLGTVLGEDDRSGPDANRNSGNDCAPVVDLRVERPHHPTAPVLSTQSQVFLVQGKEPYPVLKAKQGRRSQTNVRRGTYKFIHTAKERNGSWQPDGDSVVVPSSEQQTGEINQIVVCTVDCFAVEEKVNPQPNPPVEIPSDGRLW